MTKEEKERLIKLWGMILGYPEVTLEKVRRIGIVSMDKDGNITGNRLANDAKRIVWLEDLESKKEQKFFFGKKKKK